MEPNNPEQPNLWYMRLDQIDSNYITNPEESELLRALVRAVLQLAQQEEQMEQDELTRLEAIDAQVQGDNLPDALDMIIGAVKRVRSES